MVRNTQTIDTMKLTRMHCVFHQRMSDSTAQVSFNWSRSSAVRATVSKSAGVRLRATRKLLAPTLGVARNKHHEQREIDDQKGQQHKLDR